MSNFNERHPPMGSEKDIIDSQATTNTSRRGRYIARSSSSSSEELDELSLRVRALLAESEDEQIPEFTSHKESSVCEESQVSLVSSETGSDTQASYSSVNLECHHLVDKAIFPRKEKEQAAESPTTLKDSSSKTNYEAHDVHEILSYSYNSEVFEQKKVSFEEHAERCKTEDLFSGSDITVIEDPHSNRHQPPASSVKSSNELEISKDSSSYYPLDECLEKQTVDYHLKGRCYAPLPPLDTSLSSSSRLFYYVPCENKEKLSVDKSNSSSYAAARFSPQHSHDKDEKECPSWSRYSDCDTPSLSISSIASSKRLEWDSAADIGYTRDTLDESSSQRKSRKEPEGFSLATHKLSYGASSKYSSSTKQQLSAKDTSISEREHTSQTLNVKEKPHVSDDSYIRKDFSKKDKSVTEETLEYSNPEESFTVFESHINLEKGPSLHVHTDLSVRPKSYVMKDRESGRKNTSTKDTDTSTIYFKGTESEFPESDFIESVQHIRDSEMLKKRVSFASNKTYEGNVKILGFMKPVGDAVPVGSFEHHPCQPISDLPEEYQKHILSSPIFIDSEMLSSSDHDCRVPADNTISSSEVLPHIRWYPIPSYKSSQDIKNAATQTSLRQSKETGTSSEIGTETDKNFFNSSDVTRHVHITESVDKSPANLHTLLPEWQVTEDVDLASTYASNYTDHSDMKRYSSLPDVAGESKEFIASQIHCQLRENVIENSDIRYLHMKRIDRNALNTSHLTPQEKNLKNVDGSKRVQYENDMKDDEITSSLQYHSDDDKANSPYRTFIESEKDKQGFAFDSRGKVFKDASTQVKNCDCFNEFKNMLKKALNKIPDEHVCPFHKVLKKKLENTRQIKRFSLHSETYDVLFFGDNTHKVLDAEHSPLYFNSILMSPLRHVRKRKCVKRVPPKEKPRNNKEIRLMDEKKKILKTLYRNYAKNFSKKLAKSAVKGKVDYCRHERVLKKSLFN